MFWGKTKYKLSLRLFAVFFCLWQLVAIEGYAQSTFDFLPVQTSSDFLLLRVEGTSTIQIDQWSNPDGYSANDLLISFRQGYLKNSRKIYLQKQQTDSETFYSLSFVKPQNDTKAIALSGLARKDETLFITHKEGIDELNLLEVATKALSAENAKVEIIKFQKLPNATSVTFLKKAFRNDLKLTSQWDPQTKESTLTLFIENNSAVNQWKLNVPILSLAASDGTKISPRPKLFAAAGRAGIHVFSIDLNESSINTNFIKRTDTISPREGETFTSVWASTDTLNYATSTSTSFSIHGENMDKMVAIAHAHHKQRITDAMNGYFNSVHRSRAFTNGVMASVPFDADTIVDIFGWDLDAGLDAQLAAYGLTDSITVEEKAELERAFNRYRTYGELSGFGVMTLGILNKLGKMRNFKRAKTANNIQEINAIRQGLGLAEGAVIEAHIGKQWLSAWRAGEITLTETAEIAKQLNALKALEASGQVFTPQTVLTILKQMETFKVTVPLKGTVEMHKAFVSPLERALHTMGLASPIITKLERLSFSRLSKLFKKIHPDDLPKIFSPSTLSKWERLKSLEAFEQLSQFQKIEQFYLSMEVKLGVLNALKTSQSPGSLQLLLQPKTRDMLLWAQQKAKLGTWSEITAATKEAERLSVILNNSERAYVLDRLLQLHQMGSRITDLEKLEKLKLAIKSGWTGNVGTGVTSKAWSAAELADKRSTILSSIDRIYDFEQMRRMGYLGKLFKDGKLLETLIFTGISDGMNLGTEYAIRTYEGRPFLAPGVVHNIVFNTYIMIPIFASRGLRLSKTATNLLLFGNAVSTGYMSQKITKWGGNVFDTQYTLDKYYKDYANFQYSDLIPPPQMPLAEIPGYVTRDIFVHKDTHFDGYRAAFDSSWTMVLSTPRGIGCSWLSNKWTSSAMLDANGLMMMGARSAAGATPVMVNELAGAIAYPPIYGQWFEDNGFNLVPMDLKFKVINPWESRDWTASPKLSLEIFLHSSTYPKEVTFKLNHNGASSLVTLPAADWVNIADQKYKISWQQQVSYNEEDNIFTIEEVTLSNNSRIVGNSLEFWKDKVHQDGKTLIFPVSYQVTVERRDPFIEGMFKALLALSKEASTAILIGQKYHAAGIVHMIGNYLYPILHEFVIHEQSDVLAIDALKEAIKITDSANFSDFPITKQAIEYLTSYLDILAHKSFPLNLLTLKQNLSDGRSIETPAAQRAWLDFHTKKTLLDIEENILEETRSYYLILDEGNKNDWATLQTYKGYAYGIAQLYQWYRYQFQSELEITDTWYETIAEKLDETKNYASDLTDSWPASVYWSDSYMVGLANKFKLLRGVLEAASQR